MRYITITAARKEYKATKEEIAHLRILLNKEAARGEFYRKLKNSLIVDRKKKHKALYRDEVDAYLTEIYRKGLIGFIKDNEKMLNELGMDKKYCKRFIDIEKKHYDAPFDPKIESQINASYKLLESQSVGR